MSETSSTMEADTIIDVELAKTVASSIQTNPLWFHGFRASPESCIFTVPESLSKHNEAAYKPKTFSIGPLHHSDEHLNQSQTIKFQYVKDLITRVGVQVEELTTAVVQLEPEARKHYGEHIDFIPAKLVEIMFIDGCFIIEFLRKRAGEVDVEYNDPVFSMTNILQELCLDLMLLENQIPWMILDRLFTMTMGGKERNQEPSFRYLAFSFINRNISDFLEISAAEVVLNQLESENFRHILDLARSAIMHSTSGLQTDNDQQWESIPTAAELENVGVTLKKSESKGLTISFKDGVLEISPLHIFDDTEALFRNMIALEQCSTKYTTFVSSYIYILDDLIKTTNDINCLSSYDIIKVNINPDDALGFFNKLGHSVTIREWYYPNIGPPLNAYRRHRWPKWRAMLYRNYFNNPWVIISTLAAFVLLVLTSIQTVYSVKG